MTSSSRHAWRENFSTNLLASFIEGRNELDISGDSSEERSHNNQYLLQQKSTLKLRKNSALSLRNGLNRHERQITSEFGRQRYNGNILQNELLWENGDADARMVSGISLEEETLQLSERKAFSLGSLFTQGLIKNGAYSLQGGVRGDHHSRYGDFFAGSAGIGVDSIAGNWSVQYSRGFKAPSLYQLYGPPLTFYPVVGNRDLQPEINQSYEARWRKNISAWEFQNVLFVSRLSNLITFSATDGYRNQGGFIAEGIEPAVKWAGHSLEVRASFTHQRFRDTETTVLLRPYNHGQLRGSWFISDSIELYANGRWFDSRKDSFLGKKVRLNAFETFDLGGMYRWNSQEISLQVQNLLDRKYEEIAGFSVLPRALFGSYGVVF